MVLRPIHFMRIIELTTEEPPNYGYQCRSNPHSLLGNASLVAAMSVRLPGQGRYQYSADLDLRNQDRRAPAPRHGRRVLSQTSPMDAPDNLPLSDLYLLDSHKLLAEVTGIRGLVLQVPYTEKSHAATKTVVDAICRLERIWCWQALVAKATHFNRRRDSARKTPTLPTARHAPAKNMAL